MPCPSQCSHCFLSVSVMLLISGTWSQLGVSRHAKIIVVLWSPCCSLSLSLDKAPRRFPSQERWCRCRLGFRELVALADCGIIYCGGDMAGANVDSSSRLALQPSQLLSPSVYTCHDTKVRIFFSSSFYFLAHYLRIFKILSMNKIRFDSR